jgi:hypothetical protein
MAQAEVPWRVTPAAMAAVVVFCTALGLTTCWTGRLAEWLWLRVSDRWTG